MGAYLTMLAADLDPMRSDEERHAAVTSAAAVRATDPTGTGTPEQRNRALIAGRNPLSARERNQALAGRRVGT